MSSDIVRVSVDDPGFEDAMAVRIDVFVHEQGVPEDIERDEYEAESEHFVAYRETDDGRRQAVGTTRLRTKDGMAKIERVAVRKSARGDGLGRRLMAAAEDRARERGLDTALLHAQTAVEEFYADLGYETVGDEFDEAGIPHVEMRKPL